MENLSKYLLKTKDLYKHEFLQTVTNLLLRVNCKGKTTDNMEVSFLLKRSHFKKAIFPRFLEWDDKNYCEITTKIDLNNQVITGKTKQLST